MFINKLREKSNSTKMSSYINLFLKTEITCIPKLLQNYLGDYYSNALCNGATWVFLLWCILHVIFDKIVDVFLRKLRYREYVRIRLKNCLWYLGFYGTALVYCGATLAQNEVELFNFKRMHVPTSSSLPTQVMLGYTLLSTFYLHSSFWEALTKASFVRMCSYLFLFAVLVSSYILRIVEVSFTLTALIGIAQVTLEFTRCCFTSSIQDSFISKFIIGAMYFATFAIYIIIYIIIIPLTFIIPFGLNIMSEYPNILLMFLFTNMVLWLLTEIYHSILLKFMDHWFYHEGIAKDYYLDQCAGGFLECSLFEPRNDVSFNIQILREETKSRETKMMSMRKPKNKSMIIQTLKCMVALKRKLSEKRLSESSDSDDSEKSEDSDLRTSENTDDDTGEQDESDEESGSQETVIETEKVKMKQYDSKEEIAKVKIDEPDKRDNIKAEPEAENIDFHNLDNDKCDTNIKTIEELNVKLEEAVEDKCDIKEPQDEPNVCSCTDYKPNTDVQSIGKSNIKLEKPNENKCDNTKQSEGQIVCTKPDKDKCDINIELNKKAEPAENKCSNTKEPKYDRIICNSPSSSDVKSVEQSNIKSEVPDKCDNTAPIESGIVRMEKINKCDDTKEPKDVDFNKLDQSNDTDIGYVDVPIETSIKLKKDDKCDTKEPKDENINVNKPVQPNDNVKGNVDIAPIVISNIKSEEPDKFDNTKEHKGKLTDFSRPDNFNKSIEGSEVSTKADSVNSNVAAPLPLKNEANIQGVDEQPLDSKEAKK